MVSRVWCLVPVLALFAPAAAVGQTREPLPWYAIDLHAASVGLPTAEGWIPTVAVDTPIPDRAWGVAAAATVYPFRFGLMTIGFGAAFSTAAGESDALDVVEGTDPPELQVVRTRVTSVIPQLSLNFGHKLGWSYLSAGVGPTRVASSASAAGSIPAETVPAIWNRALNFGGGARWFMKPRLGAGFDVRFVKLGSRAASGAVPSARRTQMITFSAGISIQ